MLWALSLLTFTYLFSQLQNIIYVQGSFGQLSWDEDTCHHPTRPFVFEFNLVQGPFWAHLFGACFWGENGKRRFLHRVGSWLGQRRDILYNGDWVVKRGVSLPTFLGFREWVERRFEKKMWENIKMWGIC